MYRRIASLLITVVVIWSCLPSGATGAGITADHTSCADFDHIPQSYIESIQTNYHIYYGRASHGRQIHTGLAMLQAENSLFAPPFIHGVDVYVDQDGTGDTSWVPDIRNYLDATPACNVVMMAWCQGVARGDSASMDVYFAKMSQLEAAYPAVEFVYETGHLSRWSPVTTTINNDYIRQYCLDNEKILYDFADIESYDPDGNYYPDDWDTCFWCEDWCAVHTCPTCVECEHSHCFNCYQKGKAFWSLMAHIDGWSLASDVDPVETPNLPTSFALGQNYPNPFNMETVIEFDVPVASRVSIAVYNVLGNKVAELADREFAPGSYRVGWDGRNSDGDEVSSGMYFYRLRSGSVTQSQKMLLLK